jgi:hypothetical protein
VKPCRPGPAASARPSSPTRALRRALRSACSSTPSTNTTKLGIPVGAVTLGFPNPDKAEAFYAGISAELALEALRASESLYLGRAVNGANGEGLDDYLQQVAAKQQGQDLHQLIAGQFEAAIEALEAVPDPLSETIATDKALVELAYVEVSEQVRLLKTNLPSQTCIALTYIDNPSDSD